MSDNNEDRLNKIEHAVQIFDIRLQQTDKILEELKEAIKELVAIQRDISDFRGELREHKRDVYELRQDFEERKIVTTPIINKAENTIGKIYGAGLVIAVLLSVFSWQALQVVSKQDANTSIIQQHETKIHVLEEKIKK